MPETPSTVVCVATHSVDLDDGRTLAPGQREDNIDTSNPHNRNLVIDGHIEVIDGTTPRVRQPEELIKVAADNEDDQEEGEN